jgi:hypothetical protein
LVQPIYFHKELQRDMWEFVLKGNIGKELIKDFPWKKNWPNFNKNIEFARFLWWVPVHSEEYRRILLLFSLSCVVCSQIWLNNFLDWSPLWLNSFPDWSPLWLLHHKMLTKKTLVLCIDEYI